MSAPATATGLLETERLRLRGFADSEADAQLLLELDSDPEVMRFVGPAAGPRVEDYCERMRTVWLPYYSANPSQGFWAIIDKATGEFAGGSSCGEPRVSVRNRGGWTDTCEMELGYRLKRSAWGRGLATEASRRSCGSRLPIRRDERRSGGISAESRSTRVMEKIGMSRSASSRSWLRRSFRHLQAESGGSPANVIIQNITGPGNSPGPDGERIVSINHLGRGP